MTPPQNDDVTMPTPCQLALLNPEIQRFIAINCCGERGVFMCIMVAHSESGEEVLSIAELEFITCVRAENAKECPDSLKALFDAVPKLRNFLRSYEVKKEFLLGAALKLPNGEFGCQVGKFPAPASPS